MSDYDLITVGEMSDTTPSMAMRYINPSDKQLQMVRMSFRACTLECELEEGLSLLT